MSNLDETRRRFVAHFASIGLGSTLLPGVLWAEMQQTGAKTINADMLKTALSMSGLEFSETDRASMLENANQTLTRWEAQRKLKIPNDVSPPFHFSPIVPGIEVSRTKVPFRISDAPALKRPANLEDVAFWPVRHLAELIKTRQVTSVELTQMYLARLHKHDPKLHCVVTFLDELGMAQAKKADTEIAVGKYKGPLHGIPWGAKDIIAVKGYKTTWGSAVYTEQVIDQEASVVEMLREAGAVLIAKLTTGEFAHGDTWFGGQTRNPWNPAEGSGGSSAGPASATAAGLVGFAIGTETGGSILGPSRRCGVTGLRPTFGRISRYGVMALSWTHDRLGPMCRYAEDCALVMNVIAKPDGRDMSVFDVPFNWNAQLDIKKLRVGYIKDGFDNEPDPAAKQNGQKVLEQLQTMGVKLIPLTIPEFDVNVSMYDVESAAFFDELTRSGRDKQMTQQNTANTFRSVRLWPAVEYIQGQRARMVMMMKLAEATAGLDVYVALQNPNVGGGGARGAAPNQPQQPQNPTQRHSNMAVSAGYPGLAVPSGFFASGNPTSITFFGRPFKETEVIALGKAYQDASGHHLKHPNLQA